MCDYNNGISSLKRYFGYENNLTLLSDLSDNKKITRIMPHAFRCRPDAKEVTISEGYTEICSEAFADCFGLEKVVIPDSIKTIGSNAFRGCTGLTEVEMPQRLINMDVISSSFAGTPFGDRITEEISRTAEADIMYTLNSNGTWSLEKYTGNDKIVIIRKMVAGKNITNILSGAFAGKDSISACLSATE